MPNLSHILKLTVLGSLALSSLLPTVARQPQPAAAAGGCRIPASSTLDPISAFFASLDQAEAQTFDTGSTACLAVLATPAEAAAIAQRLVNQRAEYPGTVLQISTTVGEANYGPYSDVSNTCTTATATAFLRIAYAPRSGGLAAAANRFTAERTYTLDNMATHSSPSPVFVVNHDEVTAPRPLAPGISGPFTAALATIVDRTYVEGTYQLASRARTTALAKNGFVIDTRGSSALNFYLSGGMYTNSTNIGPDVPSFVTIDAGLHTFHVLFDRTLLAAESSSLRPRLANLLTALLRANAAQATALRGTGPLDANAANAAYLAVALELLGATPPAGTVPAAVAAIAGREVDLVSRHAGPARSPFLGGLSFDYRLFTPRGHYAYAKDLSTYFMAMNWLALVQAPLEAKAHVVGEGQARAGVQRAVLLTALLFTHSGSQTLLQRWHELADPIATLIGEPVGSSMPDLVRLVQQTYGKTPSAATLESAPRLSAFGRMVHTLAAPAFLNTASFSTVRALSLFPARQTPDGSLAAALTWPNVGTTSDPRSLPSGLDVMAALGSPRAAQLAQASGPSARYATALKRAVPRFAKDLKAPTIYAQWLATLKPLAQPMPKAAPPAMHTPAWTDKELQTALASWSELRHDSILYGAQNGGYGGGGDCGSVPVNRTGYVEPIPGAWADLRALSDRLLAVTRSAGLLNQLPAAQRAALMNAATIYRDGLQAFATIAAEELHGKAPTPSQNRLLHDPSPVLGQPMGVFFTKTPDPLTAELDQQAAEIADVATSAQDGRVLEVGEGRVHDIWVLVPIDGWQWLARGQVYSYYEFTTGGNRYSDAQWRQLLESPSAPRQQAWIRRLSD